MILKFDEEWLKAAIELEDAVDGHISAGLNLGCHAGDYLAQSQGFISRQKMASMLAEELGSILDSADIEAVIDAAQNCVNEKISIRMQSDRVA